MTDNDHPLHRELKRKAFHLAALIYILGVVLIPRTIFIEALVAGLIGVTIFETLRLKFLSFNAIAMGLFGGLYREQEKTQFSGVFWLMAGVLVTVLLLRPIPLIVTVLLYVVLGDTAASIAGIGIGGVRWPGSHKTLVGSASCFAVCFVAGAVLLRPAYGWIGIVAGAAVATLFESGVVRVNDNFLIPFTTSITLAFCYRLI
jgi:dolichol kinase